MNQGSNQGTIEYLAKKLSKELQECNDEVPVGSMICEPICDHTSKKNPSSAQYRILSLCRSLPKKEKDPTSHSEINSIRVACKKKGSERLPNCIMISSLEPCLMCSGAIILARLKQVYYFASAEKAPGLRWILEKASPPLSSENKRLQFNHYPELFLLENEKDSYRLLLQSFFQQKRIC